ncbi:unnamed protein product, partial [Choristocarpus tenellus]
VHLIQCFVLCTEPCWELKAFIAKCSFPGRWGPTGVA